jgi:recombination protein RecA
MAHRGLIKVETGRKDPQFSSKNEELAIGKNMGFDIPKNKTAPPHASGIFDFYFKDYPELGIHAGDIDIAAQMLAYGLKYAFVNKAGAWYSAGDERLGQGKTKAKAALMEQPELCQDIWEKACLTELGFVA